jgi:hypothetical protein
MCNRATAMLTREDIRHFLSQGYVHIEAAVPPKLAAACRAVIWGELARDGILEHDPATWTEPLARFPCPDGGPFVDAGWGPRLLSAYDQLIGPGRWRRHDGLGGNIFARFPSEVDPLQTKWHVDGAFRVGDEWRNNVHCKEKGLLALFLFSETTQDDAPTLLLAGSHLDMVPVLEPFGEAGLPFEEICRRVPAETLDREVVRAIGHPGDVYLCHPLLVHSPSWYHRGRNPRFLAQPGIGLLEPFALTGATPFPVEQAIMARLTGARVTDA